MVLKKFFLISICAKFTLTTIYAPGQRMFYFSSKATKRSARRGYLKDYILKEKEVKSRNGDWEAFRFGTPFFNSRKYTLRGY